MTKLEQLQAASKARHKDKKPRKTITASNAKPVVLHYKHDQWTRLLERLDKDYAKWLKEHDKHIH